MPDLYYGGARGGGKSDFLLGDFLTRSTRYGKMAGVLCRRTYQALGDLIDRAKEIYGVAGWRWVGGDELCYRNPDTDAVLRFRNLETLDDAEKYQGFNNQWVGLDEMEQWADPRALDKLYATLRSSRGIPTVRRCAGNPGGAGHVWIKKRYHPDLWEPPDGPYVHTRYRPQPKAMPEMWVDALFIPAFIEDNAYLPKDYEQAIAIAAGSDALFRAWRWGDWSVIAGTYFDCFDPDVHVVESAEIMPWDSRWLSMDWGFVDDSAVHWHSSNEEQRVVTYQEHVTNHKTATELGEEIAALCVPPPGGGVGVECPKAGCGLRHDTYKDFVLSPDAFGEKVSERTIGDELGDVMASHGLRRPRQAVAGPRTRIPGWQLMYQLLSTRTPITKVPYWTMTKNCKVLAESLPLLVHEEKAGKDPNDCADHPQDHAPDSCRMGLQSVLRQVKEPIEVVAARMVRSSDPTIHAIQSMKAEAMIEKAREPLRFKRRRSRF